MKLCGKPVKTLKRREIMKLKTCGQLRHMRRSDVDNGFSTENNSGKLFKCE